MNTKNEPFYVVPLETDDTNYLEKIAVKQNSEGEMDVDLEDEGIKEFDIEFDKYDDDDQPAYSDNPEEDGDNYSQD